MAERRFRLLVLTAVSCVGVMAVTTGAAFAATATAGSWTVQTTPANDGLRLTAVSCASESYCLAVGSGQRSLVS